MSKARVSRSRTTSARSGSAAHAQATPAGYVPAHLTLPCDAPTIFAFDLLTALSISGVVLGSLQYLLPAAGVQFTLSVQTVPISPALFFLGNGIGCILVAAMLASALTQTFCHVRYFVNGASDLRPLSMLGFLIILAITSIQSFTTYRFYTDPRAYQELLTAHCAMQSIMIILALYFAAMLKSELMWRVFEQTSGSAVALLAQLEEGELSTAADREWIRRCIAARSGELADLEGRYERHLESLARASRNDS